MKRRKELSTLYEASKRFYNQQGFLGLFAFSLLLGYGLCQSVQPTLEPSTAISPIWSTTIDSSVASMIVSSTAGEYSSNTAVVTSTAFTGPTIVPPSTKPPGPSFFRWNISYNGQICVLMEGSNLSFAFEDPRIGDSMINKHVGMLNAVYGEPHISGRCQPNDAIMHVDWKNTSFEGSFNMTLEFVRHPSAGTWEADRITHIFDNETLFSYVDQNYFKSPVGSAYSCGRRITYSVLNEATMIFSDFTVQAFPYFNHFSDEINHCTHGDKPSGNKHVALIVGLTVGSIIIVAAIGILIARSSLCQSEYDRLK